MVSKTEKMWAEILIGLLAGMIIGALTLPKEVWASEIVLQVPQGTTVIEDINTPTVNQIKEAEAWLSENRIEIPKEVKDYAKQYGKKYDICPEIIEAICWVESNCIAEVSNSSGCHGLMQVKSSSHRKRMDRLNVTDLHDAESNIKTGTDYLAELLQDNEIEKALSLYNGQDKESTGYSRKVLKIAQALEIVRFK